MKLLSILLLVSFSLTLKADDESEHVMVLTQDNFDDVIKENKIVLVKFYAPWCGHCKSMAPEYEKAAKKLKDDGANVVLGKVDATVHTDLATRYKVQGYPTLKFFREGSDMEYSGPRDSEGIVQWINKKLGPVLTDIKTMADLEKMKTDNKMVAVILAHENNDHVDTLTEFASKTDVVPFAIIKEKSIASQAGLTDKLTLLKSFDDPKVPFTGRFDQETLNKFVKLEQVPLVTEFTQESAQIVFESEIKTHVIAFSGKKAEDDYKKHMEILKKVAVEFKGKCHVVIIDMDDAPSQRVGEFFDVTSNDVPTYRVLKMGDAMLKFVPETKDFDDSAMKKFIGDVIAGKVKPHLKSADEPSDWDSQPVKVLVAKTFKDRAVIKDKAVFVEFYAPWCGHCKALAPIWDEVGEHYKGNDDIVIAKCDATENEFEEIKIESFPTLKFSPKGSTEFIDYKGDRTKEQFIEYIDSNGKSGGKKSDDADKHDEL